MFTVWIKNKETGKAFIWRKDTELKALRLFNKKSRGNFNPGITVGFFEGTPQDNDPKDIPWELRTARVVEQVA